MLLEMPTFRYRNALSCAVSRNERSDPSAGCDNPQTAYAYSFHAFSRKPLYTNHYFAVDSNSYTRISVIITAIIIIIIILIIQSGG